MLFTNDVLLIDKKVGTTSFETIKEVKRILKLRKLGHSGTLDKFASGLLILCTGRATKLTRYFLDSDKRYIGKVKLGISTDTYDNEGEIIQKRDASFLSVRHIQRINEEFTGELIQVPPQYSAIKIGGKRASDLVREGKKPELQGRKVNIKKLEILAIDLDNFLLTIDVVCSKGTYIRALARDIGEFLNTGAHLESLRRIESGIFKIENAVSTEELKEFINGSSIEKNFYFLPRDAISYFGSITVDKKGKTRALNGAQFDKTATIDMKIVDNKPFRILDDEENLIAIVDIDIDNWTINYLNVFN